MNATAIPVQDLTCQLLDTAAGIPTGTAAAGLIISHGHFLHRAASRRTITAGTSICTGRPLAAIGWDAALRALETGLLPCASSALARRWWTAPSTSLAATATCTPSTRPPARSAGLTPSRTPAPAWPWRTASSTSAASATSATCTRSTPPPATFAGPSKHSTPRNLPRWWRTAPSTSAAATALAATARCSPLTQPPASHAGPTPRETPLPSVRGTASNPARRWLATSTSAATTARCTRSTRPTATRLVLHHAHGKLRCLQPGGGRRHRLRRQ